MKLNLSYLSKSTLIILVYLNGCSVFNTLGITEHFIKNPQQQKTQHYHQQMRELKQQPEPPFDNLRNRSDLAWSEKCFTFGMYMLFDCRIYNPDTNEYTLQSFIKQGEKLYGGYDILLLWHGYPRLGIDERNQFDFWHDLPGRLEKLRQLVTLCHQHHVRIILPYNPWDTGTRSESNTAIKRLVDLVKQTNADGVFLDTMSTSSPELRKMLDEVRPGLIIVTEGIPPQEQLGWVNSSWGQWLNIPSEPSILKLKWMQPQHQQYLINRWDRDRSEEIATAFFNNAGVIVWDNIFGAANPWNAFDQSLWKKTNLILHHFSDLPVSGQWIPFVDTLSPDLYANLWQDENNKLYIFINKGGPSESLPLIALENQDEYDYYDLWHGEKIQPAAQNTLSGPINRIGCIAAIRKSSITPDFIKLTEKLRKIKPETTEDNHELLRIPSYSNTVCRTELVSEKNLPEGMVYIPETTFDMHIQHQRRECGCYLDKPAAKIDNFGYGLSFGAVYPNVIHKEIEHEIGSIQIKAFFIDETEVTNAQFKTFLNTTGYRPKHLDNFLKHWPKGKMPSEVADHPVVYVDIDDAKAYARWAGKRLPTEAEWQLAAQGTDNRKWPWGDTFDPNKCTVKQPGTAPVCSYPEGKSPYGCYHMSGNVWEWTDAIYNDGYTRFTMIRGGSYYNAEGSIWYAQGNPQPCGHHTKFILTWAGLDRCSTVGFRCVKDIK